MPRCFTLFLLLLLQPALASAATVTIPFTAEILASSSPSFPSGSIVAGVFSYDDASPLISDDGTTALYDATGLGSISIEGVVGEAITFIRVNNDVLGAGDSFQLGADSEADAPTTRVWFSTPDASLFPSTAIPSALALEDFELRRLDVVVPDGAVFGTILSFGVPEPGLAGILGLGLLSVARRRRR